jgi:hypothetical protein
MRVPQQRIEFLQEAQRNKMTRHHQVHVSLNDELHSSLIRLARQNDETVATTLRRILHEHFQRRDEQQTLPTRPLSAGKDR